MGTRHRRLSCGHVECRDGVYGQHSAAGVPDHRLCRRSEEQPIDGIASMSTNDNEVGRLLLCKSEQLTVRAAAHDDLFDSDTSRFESLHDLMQVLGTDLLMVCSNVSPESRGGVESPAPHKNQQGVKATKTTEKV